MPDETEITTETTEETAEETKEETKETIVDKIKNKIKEFTSSNEEPTEIAVPDDFSKAALNAGWSSEDIQDFAKDFSEEELHEMIPTLIGEDTDESDETSDTLEEEETNETKDEDSQEDEQVKKLLERIEALEKAQGKAQEDNEKQEIVNLVHRASQTFDELSEEFEIFGKTDKLPKFPDGRLITTSPAMKARKEVFALSMRLKDSGMDFDEAMSVSLNAFKGKNLSNDVKRNLIKDLKKKEQRLSGKRTSHESSSGDMSGPDIIKAVLARNNKQ